METKAIITSQLELAQAMDTEPSRIARDVYDGTECGAWITLDDTGVSIGSIVEGVDEGVYPTRLDYPFTIECFWEELDEIDKAADAIWMETHGCPGCAGVTEEEWDAGGTPVNPDCEECGGDGTVI